MQDTKLSETEKKKMVIVYEETEKMLKEIAKSAGLDEKELEKYYTPEHNLDWLKTLTGVSFERMDDPAFIMCRLMMSLQNSGRKSKVIDFASNGKTLAKAFRAFGPEQICADEHFKKIVSESKDARFRTEQLSRSLDKCILRIEKESESKLQINRNEPGQRFSMWDEFIIGSCQGACFIKDFTKKEFYDENSEKRLIEDVKRIRGIGPALAADFLKESGILDIGKPDIHIEDILFNKIKIAPSKSPDALQKTLKSIASCNKQKVYKVDKMLWLVCASGNSSFYMHFESNKDALIHRITKRMKEEGIV